MIKRYFISISILFILAIVTYFFSLNVPSQQNSQYAEQLPLFLAGWSGKDFEVDNRTLELLETNDVLMREYRKKDLPSIQLCVVYASSNRKVSHPPEVCYRGGGWSIEEREPVLFSVKSDEYPEFRAMKLISEKGDQKQLVIYWYKSNKKYTGNYYKQQINIVKNQIITGNSTSGLLRLSTMIDNNNEYDAMMRLQEFSINMLPSITKYLP